MLFCAPGGTLSRWHFCALGLKFHVFAFAFTLLVFSCSHFRPPSFLSPTPSHTHMYIHLSQKKYQLGKVKDDFLLYFSILHMFEVRVSSETSFVSKQPKLGPKLVSALSETRCFNIETRSFGVLIQPKQTKDKPKQQQIC